MALNDLTIDGSTVEGFKVTTLNYDVKLPIGTTEVPTVEAVSDNENEVIEITPPESLPGTTIITVTLDETTTTYKINFTVTTLLDEVKNYLDITWTDTATDLKLSGIIDRGQNFLNKKTNSMLDFEIEGRPKELLFEYCRFARNGILNEFETAYLPMLVDLIADGGGSYGLL